MINVVLELICLVVSSCVFILIVHFDYLGLTRNMFTVHQKKKKNVCVLLVFLAIHDDYIKLALASF